MAKQVRNCTTKNPLLRDGLKQDKRLLPALDPNYVKIDERSLADFLCLYKRLSGKLQYYDINNQPKGDWLAFIEQDMSTVIAAISKRDLGDEKRCLQDQADIFDNINSTEGELKIALKATFDLILTRAVEIDGWYRKSIAGFDLRVELDRIIPAQLQDALRNALGYYFFANQEQLLTTQAKPEGSPELLDMDNIKTAQLRHIWYDSSYESWAAFIASFAETGALAEFAPAFGEASAPPGSRILDASGRVLASAQSFLDAESQLIRNASAYLEKSVEDWPNHQPHFALLLAFTRLFETTQAHLNGITARHLDFYYKQVLRLQERPEVTDKVHLVFELVKNAAPYLLKAGTLVKAGKDATGAEINYQLDNDIFVNKAKVAALKTVFLDRQDGGRVYAVPAANSQDGFGGEFETPEPRWSTFGLARTNNLTEIGFAVTSPMLFLAEGNRTIDVTINLVGTSIPSLSLQTNQFLCLLTSADGWVAATIISISEQGGTIKFRLSLTQTAPAIVSYAQEAHGGNYQSDFPVLKILLNSNSTSYPYQSLRDLLVNSIDLVVTVKNVRNLILQNDLGLLDPAKPFQPLGPSPVVGSNFYVGSAEVFAKNLDTLTLNYEWLDAPKNFATHYAVYNDPPTNDSFQWEISILRDKDWGSQALTTEQMFPPSPSLRDILAFLDKFYSQKGAAPDSFESLKKQGFKVGEEVTRDVLLKEIETSVRDKELKLELLKGLDELFPFEKGMIYLSAASQSGLAIGHAKSFEPLQSYRVDTQRGFMRLQLQKPAKAFYHNEFARVYAQQVAKLIADNSTPLPNEPYTPTIKHLSLDYSSSKTINLSAATGFANRVDKFFHINPFGEKEVHTQLQPLLYLMPQFSFTRTGVTHQNAGELYIGITGLQPRQNLALLFQLAEGSADPELPKQSIDWSYLSDNEWIAFEDNQLLFDSTNGLLSSGIITFDMPKETSANNTLLPEGQHWLRSSVTENTRAVPDLIEVRAQAAQASFLNRNNDPNFLATPLPAESVSGLQVSKSAVKSVSQPYASVGGRVKEQAEYFNTRVSERLRHKGRGITVNDYEKLILERFPQIHKVKCINHSTYNFETEDVIIAQSEFSPGFVSVIVIPDLRNKNAVDPLEPRIDLATLQEISDFLKGLISPFAAQRLRVLNPNYEGISVEVRLALRSGYDWGFYQTQLVKDVQSFLSPWAFEVGKDISFGGRIHKSSILNFIEERPYVDFITEIKMSHVYTADDGMPVTKDVLEATPASARSILVSEKTHTILEAA